MAYRLKRLDEPIFMAGPKPMRKDFGIHQRLESCVKEKTFLEVLSSPSVQTDVKIKPALTMCLSLLPYSSQSAKTPYFTLSLCMNYFCSIYHFSMFLSLPSEDLVLMPWQYPPSQQRAIKDIACFPPSPAIPPTHYSPTPGSTPAIAVAHSGAGPM